MHTIRGMAKRTPTPSNDLASEFRSGAITLGELNARAAAAGAAATGAAAPADGLEPVTVTDPAD